MDKTPKSISSSCNNGDRVLEETAMEKVLSDLNALNKLYGLLQRLDETPRALLKNLLDDAARQALLNQANAFTTASDSVMPFSLGLASPKKMDQAMSRSSSFRNNKEAEMEQISSDLQALTRLYMLLHKGPTDENLDEASKILLMKILEDATQEAVRRQAKMLSGSQVSPALERELSKRSDCRTQHGDPRLSPMVSPRPSLLAIERSRQLKLQDSTVSSRSGLHVDGHRHASEGPPFARLASKGSSRTALPARHRPSQEQRHSSLSLHRFSVAGTLQHGTVTRGTNRRDSIRRNSGRGDQWLLERNSSQRSVLRELSLEPSSSLHDSATPRHFGRLDSKFSVSMTSCHGVEHRIRPSNSLHTVGSLHRSAAEERRTWRGRQQGSDVSSVDTYSVSMSSGSRSSSDATSLSASTSPMASPAPPPFANPYYPPPVMKRGIAPPTMTRGISPRVYAPKVSRSMRRRRRQEILEKRVARLHKFKDMIAAVFHHHRRHHLGGGQEADPSSKSVVRGAGHLSSPWHYVTSMFHRVKGKAKNTRSRTVAGVPEKRRRGGRNMHALFDAMRRHLKGKRTAPAAGMKLRRKASRTRAKWQRLRRQRGMAGVTAGSRPRRRLGHGMERQGGCRS